MATTMSEKEAIETVVFRVREALASKRSTSGGREVYAVKDLVQALNDVLDVARAAGVG